MTDGEIVGEERERKPSPPSPSNPLEKVLPNPLSDTTTTDDEGARPSLLDCPSDASENAAGRGRTMESPFPSIYGLGDVQDGNEDQTPDRDHSTEKDRATGRFEDREDGQDGTWTSNTLTLASSSTAVTASGKGQNKQNGRVELDWEETWERQKRERWQEKVRQDLQGWRGGHGTPRSNYHPTAVTANSYYGSAVTGTIGRDLPKEVLRVERDWSDGEVCQFETSFPMELDRRITPTQFHDFVTDINTHLSSAYSSKAAVIDNLIAIATWWISLWFRPGHFETKLREVERLIAQANKETFNPVGLNVLSPRSVALQFLEIEYY